MIGDEREPGDVLCVVHPDLDEVSVEALEAHFEGRGGVKVLQEARRRERRADVRRRHDRTYAGEDRRGVRNPNGRRIDDRRRAVVGRAPLALPRRLGAIRDRVEFAIHDPGEAKRVAIAESLRLVVAFQLGEPDAFRAIYERHFDGVYGYLRTALRDRHDAEDGAQEVFIRALRGLERYQFTGSPFEAWLFRIARNHTLNVKRRAEPVSPAEPARIDLWRDDRELRAQSGSTPAARDQQLLVFIERLPASQRQVLVLRYMVGLDWADIATILDRSRGAARQLEQRAFTYLRKRLDAVDQGSSPRTRALPMARRTLPSPVAASRRGALLGGTRAA